MNAIVPFRRGPSGRLEAARFVIAALRQQVRASSWSSRTLCAPAATALREAKEALNRVVVRLAVCAHRRSHDGRDRAASQNRRSFPKAACRGARFVGGAVMMTYEAWEAVGGCDDRMMGWGGRRRRNDARVERLRISHLTLLHTAHHLWHVRVARNADLYRRNCAHLERIRALTEEELCARRAAAHRGGSTQWASD